jgi:uracil DNA glycosylase superfamily protein
MIPTEVLRPTHSECLTRLAERVTACRACPSMPPERRRVPGHGPSEAVLALVGEAPGRFGADRTGVPFSGDRSGAFLRELIAELGLDADRDVYITNVVKCNPRDERGNNRAPSPEEIAAARTWRRSCGCCSRVSSCRSARSPAVCCWDVPCGRCRECRSATRGCSSSPSITPATRPATAIRGSGIGKSSWRWAVCWGSAPGRFLLLLLLDIRQKPSRSRS